MREKCCSTWCDQCHRHGHSKWLWLGTHRTHRIYMRWQIKKTVWKLRLGLRKKGI